MNTTTFNLLRSRGTLVLLAGIGLILPAAQAMAQDDAGYPPAPPVDYYNAPSSINNVFNWQDVPQNQVVPIDRAVFDQGGYQLYDQQGETIVVPFQNNNLYVMKFAVSQTGQTYFVNDQGQAPVLYVPRGGYLENATVAGARWYPFNQQFCPSRPVFLGIAPSYSDYVSMGWYPDEVCHGGYYGSVSFFDGGFFGPTLGLTFIFGGHHYDGWDGYREYSDNYPAPYRTGWSHRNYYQFAGRPDYNRSDNFSGGNGRTQFPSGGGSGFGGRGQYSGTSRPTFGGTGRSSGNQGGYSFTNRPTFGGTTSRPTFGGGTTTRPSFGGATSSRPTFGGGSSSQSPFGGATSSRPSFGGAATTRPSFGGASASRPNFNGVRQSPSFSDSGPTQRSFQGFSGDAGTRSFGNQSASRPSFGGSQPARSSSFGNQGFSGAASRPSFGGATPRPSFGGGQAPRSDSSFGGGQMPRSNGNTGNFPAPRSNNESPAPRSNGNPPSNSSPRSFGSFNGNRGFGR